MKTTRVLELYCGIGGMHWALKMTKLPFEIIAAMEINTSVLETYIHNFPKDNALNRNIQSLTAEEINEMQIDLIAMSPPCQPFCRTGLKMDIKDPRTDSFQHLLKILPNVNFRYLLLENVKGFEESEARQLLLETLKKCHFQYQEFLLTPTTIGIPNSRQRYYLLGKHEEIQWCFTKTESIHSTIPHWESPLKELSYGDIVLNQNEIWNDRRKEFLEFLHDRENFTLPTSWCVGDVIETFEKDASSEYYLKPNVILKYGKAMDIVNLKSVQTCCFTKSYGQFVKGTGSILDFSEVLGNDDGTNCLRFFTPREISRLLCYPDTFTFPSNLSWKQKAKSLGNSINVYVVSILMALLLKDSKE